MSLFGALMGFGDIDEDPFFGGTMHQMNNMMNTHLSMMNSIFGGPAFGGMLEGPLGSQMVPYGGRRMRDDFGMGLMPMGFPNMRSMFEDVGNSHSFSQSTVMTMSSGPDGRPQVYQASTSMRQGPGGVKETRKSVADSRSGIKKMQIGHHIGERAHVIEREKNFRSGAAEERQEFINLDEDEADDFNREWQTKITGGRSGIPHSINYTTDRRHHNHQPQLALPSSSSIRGPEIKKKRPHEYDPENSQNYRKKNFKKGGVRPTEPVPVVEEPESSDEDSDRYHKKSYKNVRNTIIEELE